MATDRRSRRARLMLAGGAMLFGTARHAAGAGDGFDVTLPPSYAADPQAAPPSPGPRINADGPGSYLADWGERVARARASQPSWSSPLVTTTGLLEQRVRFDIARQHSGNGTDTTVLDGGRGVDLIVGEQTEVQIGADPYYIRSGVNAGSIAPLSGFADWPVLRLEQRLASSPADAGDYVVTTWVQIQAPTGIDRLTSDAWQFVPTLAFGEGWGDFDVQGTVGAVLPAARAETIGYAIQTNVAFQYRVLRVFWPELEVNWTYYATGQRGGLSQIYLTPGLVVGRFAVTDGLRFTFGVGYQTAVSPGYRAKPLTPAYDHAWLFTTRLNF